MFTNSTAARTIRIGTRESKLARAQTQLVLELVVNKYPGVTIEVVPVTTRGDQVRDKPIAEIGTQGVFVKELEQALFERTVDIVVHSLKDLPSDIPTGLILAAVLDREDPRDVLISKEHVSFRKLPPNSKIATSSRRRMAQLKYIRPDLQFVDIRGNIDTRLRKHEEGQCDAIVLAAAGIIRLGLRDKITEFFEPELITPAAGQGALALECRADDEEMIKLSALIDDPMVRAQVESERSLLKQIGGGCSVPVGVLATVDNTKLKLIACVAAIDGSSIIRETIEGHLSEAKALGIVLANALLKKGAASILEPFVDQAPPAISPP